MKVRISPGALLMIATLPVSKSALLPASLLAALFHECGHLLAAHLLGIRLRLLEFDLFGARLYPAGQLPSYVAEAALVVAGPLASLLLWVFLLPFTGSFSLLLRGASLSFAFFNLMLISGFDGGRLLFSFAASLWGSTTAERILEISSYLSLLFLFALSACMLLRYGQNRTLAVLSASLFAKVFLPHNMER